MIDTGRFQSMQPYALTVDKYLDHAAKWHPSVAVVTQVEPGQARRIGYAELRERSNRFSGALLALGVQPGDTVATLGWNTQGHVEAWYGAMGVGMVCHTLNPRLTAFQLGEMALQSAPKVLAVGSGLLPLAEQIAAAVPSIAHLVLLDETAATAAGGGARLWALDDLLAAHGAPAGWGLFDEETPAGLCFTSGTTGAPKGVLYTHRSNALLTMRSLQADVIAITARDAVLMAVPMFHANGWGLPFAAPAVGAKLVLPGRVVDGPQIARLIAAEGVTVAVGVPTVWTTLVDHLERTGETLPTLKRVLVGGASMPQALLDRIEDRLGVVVQTSWGMTELSPLGTISPPDGERRIAASAGRIPAGGDLLLTDSRGVALPEQRGVEGHLRIRGGSTVQRYFGEDRPCVDEDGWFDTGDLAVIDPDGSLRITGRAKDLIKSGGEWINPVEIEAVVGGLAGVDQVAVVARFDRKWGERPILIVEGGDALPDDAAILHALRGKVASWWLPDAIIRLDAMPLAATGKVDKRRLRETFGKQSEMLEATQ